MISSLADFLQTEGVGTVGSDIFIGEIPLDVSDAIALTLVPSPAPDKSIPYYTQTIDVWGRFTDSEDGLSMLQSVFDAVHRQENYAITGYHVYLSYAAGMIEDMDRDTERRKLYKLTLSFLYRAS
jgi:hypothetical protein